MQKIFLVISKVVGFTGSEITAYEYAIELKNLGYKVTVGSFEISNFFRNQLENQGINCLDVLEQKDTIICDILWLFHNTTYNLVKKAGIVKTARVVFSSLSLFEPLECPPVFIQDIDLITVNSVESFEFYSAKYPDLKSKLCILVNSCPTKFSNIKNIHSPLISNVAIISNHIPDELNYLLRNRGDISYYHYGAYGDVRLIEDTDLIKNDAVISIGKTIQYCLTLKVPIYCYDHFGGPGWITPSNIKTAAQYNFSGRCTKTKKTAIEIDREIKYGYLGVVNEISKLHEIACKDFSLSINIGKILKILDNNNSKNIKRKFCISDPIELRIVASSDIFIRDQILLLKLTKYIKELQAQILEAKKEYDSEILNSLTIKSEVKQKNQLITDKEEELIQKNQLVIENEERIAELQNQVKMDNEKIVQLKSSYSWKITKPLRYLTNVVIRIYYSIIIILKHRNSGIFDRHWYLKRYNDVRFLRFCPFVHFSLIGVHENRSPNENFAVEDYLHNNYITESKYNYTLNYAIRDWEEQKHVCTNKFDLAFYKKNNKDVLSAGIEPFLHYIKYGIHEGRSAKAIDLNKEKARLSVSIIIPTYNRADKLERLIEPLVSSGKGLDFEIILVNDGSTDMTRNVLIDLEAKYSEVRGINISNQGAGIARNHGANNAKKDIVLFIGDDIIPKNDNFILAHILHHQINSQVNFSVLGNVVWPSDDLFEITPVMKHIQGHGGEQFGYFDMEPFRCWDWRFFYTCNVSVKREIVSDWINEGFSPQFTGCGFEDGEFAYRMEKNYGRFDVFYTTDSLGYHYHRHDVESFLSRQRFIGAMAYTLFTLHPEILPETGFHELYNMLNINDIQNMESIPEYMDQAQALFEMTIDLQKNKILGSELWHKELLHCIFKLSAYLGFIETATTPNSNYLAGLKYAVDSTVGKLRVY